MASSYWYVKAFVLCVCVCVCTRAHMISCSQGWLLSLASAKNLLSHPERPRSLYCVHAVVTGARGLGLGTLPWTLVLTVTWTLLQLSSQAPLGALVYFKTGVLLALAWLEGWIFICMLCMFLCFLRPDCFWLKICFYLLWKLCFITLYLFLLI